MWTDNEATMSEEPQKIEVTTAQDDVARESDPEPKDNAPSRKDARFWFILSGLLLSTFIAVLEAVSMLLVLHAAIDNLCLLYFPCSMLYLLRSRS